MKLQTCISIFPSKQKNLCCHLFGLPCTASAIFPTRVCKYCPKSHNTELNNKNVRRKKPCHQQKVSPSIEKQSKQRKRKKVKPCHQQKAQPSMEKNEQLPLLLQRSAGMVPAENNKMIRIYKNVCRINNMIQSSPPTICWDGPG